MQRAWKLTIVLFSSLLISACSTNKVQLNYDATGISAPATGSAVISSVSVKDSRDTEADWLGAIRGGFGQPLKTLLADRPVKEVVQNAFLDALKARGMLTEAGAGTLELAVDVRKFDCSQYVRREGHAIFAISVIDLGTRQSSFDKTVRVDRTVGDTAAFDAGIFASVEDLRVVAKDTLKEAIDDALDDPQLRSALGQS